MDIQSNLYSFVNNNDVNNNESPDFFNGKEISYEESLNIDDEKNLKEGKQKQKELPFNLIPTYFKIKVIERDTGKQGYIEVFFQPPTKKEYSIEDINQNTFFKINPGHSKEGLNAKRLLQLYCELTNNKDHVLDKDLVRFNSPYTYKLVEAKGKTMDYNKIDKLLEYLDVCPDCMRVSLTGIGSSKRKNISQILYNILYPFSAYFDTKKYHNSNL